MDFSVPGDPGVIEARATSLRTRGQGFIAVADSLSTITTDGWSGRAADRFRSRFEVEPVRWRTAGDGFLGAAGALTGWAGALRAAQASAAWCASEWERGEAVTAQARAAYDADVRAARAEKAAWEAENGPGTYTLTIHPFTDPGEPIREAARSEFAAARTRLDSEAHACAAGVRAGCSGAPAQRNWLESGLAFVGGVIYGAGEALWEIGELGVNLTFGPLFDLVDLATGELTPEELAAKKQLQLEMVQGLWTALTTDPWQFGITVGKAVLDWDTWSDDPARALGHLVPDAVLAVATAGAGTAATRGASATSALARHTDDLVDGARALDRLDGLGDLRHLDDLSDVDLVTEVADLARLGGTGEGPLGLPINQFPGNEAIRRFMESVPPLPGFYDVGLHGGPRAVEIALSDGRVVLADHRLLSELITRAPDYDGGSVRLVSCSTGAVPDGIAQNLANKLGKDVLAPTDKVWIWPDGSTGVGPGADRLTGSWQLFTPGGQR